MDANVAVLASRSKAAAVRVEHERVDRTEMPPNLAHLTLIDLVVEQRLELPLARRRGRHIRRGLTATDHDLQPPQHISSSIITA